MHKPCDDPLHAHIWMPTRTLEADGTLGSKLEQLARPHRRENTDPPTARGIAALLNADRVDAA